jgi:serine protease Do
MKRRLAGRLPAPAAGVLLGCCLTALTVNAAAQEARPAPAPTRSCGEALPALFKKISPAVVSIGAMAINPYDLDHRVDRVSGSGVIIVPTGFILTNSHVVFDRQVITVTLDDGTTLPAQLVGADPIFDIAVIKIPQPTQGELPAVRLGDSDEVAVGEEVYAIGNPLGLDQTLTRGVVSAVNRLLPGVSWSLTEPLIQTDAAINPGSSGGPLIDGCGDVVGITTALLPDAQSIGFAVPANLIKDVVPQLLEKGRVVRPWLGVQGQFVVPGLKELLRVPLTDGFLVEAVDPGSPAERQGVRGGEFEITIGDQPVLLGGDIVTEVNGTKVDTADKLSAALDGLTVGSTVHLTLFRNKEVRKLDIVLVERPLLPWDIPSRRPLSGVVPGSRPAAGRQPRATVRAF